MAARCWLEPPPQDDPFGMIARSDLLQFSIFPLQQDRPAVVQYAKLQSSTLFFQTHLLFSYFPTLYLLIKLTTKCVAIAGSANPVTEEKEGYT